MNAVTPQRTGVDRRGFIVGAGAAVVGLSGVSALGWPDVAAAAGVEPGASYFDAVTPTRVCDTRRSFGAIELGGGTRRVRIAGNLGVPSDAVAAVVTVTAVASASAPNHLRVYPAGSARPEVSAVNIPDQGAVANSLTVKLGTGGSGTRGSIDIYSPTPTHVIIDVQGVYRPTSSPVAAGRFIGLPQARRVFDSRAATSQRRIPAGSNTWIDLSWLVPRDARAVVANLTLVQPELPAYLTAYPPGPRPQSSNVNGPPGQVRAVAIQTKLGYDAAQRGTGFYIFNSQATHILVDVSGYVSGPSSGASADGLFVPIDPIRLHDSRKGSGSERRLWPGWTRDIPMPSEWASKAQAVAVNLGAVRVMNNGYFTVLPASTTRGTVSSLNATVPGMTIANSAISRVSRNGVACFSSAGAHFVLDATGWFTGAPTAATVATANPAPPAAAAPWTLQIARMGITQTVYAGNPNIVDRGHGWHWPGTGQVGQAGAMIGVFGHRTEGPAPWRNGGAYRYQERLQTGDIATLTTVDGRRYTYRYVGRTLTDDDGGRILRATQRLGADTLSLIACSKPDFSPTSLDYRIVSTFQLVGWEDIG